MNTQDHIDAITEAQALLCEALIMLQEIARTTRNDWAENYIIAPLAILINSDHGYMSRDANIEDWLRDLASDEDDTDSPLCPFCDGPVEPDPTRPGVTICGQCGEPAAYALA